jgi:RNA polymerase sigma-70 factor (ECF subfamily)
MMAHVATARAMGRPEDFHSFFLAEHDQLFRTLLLASGSREDAEDLAQEAMVRVLERWERRHEIRSLHTYLYAVAFNLLRRRRRREALGAKLLGLRTRLLLETDPHDETHDEIHDLQQALAGLPTAERDALVLVEWLGLSSAEAAKVMRLTPSSVRGRLHRAKKRLKQRVKELDDE